MALNDKQIAFVDAYVRLRNAAAAAREAGYSPAMVHGRSYEMMRNPEIRGAISARFKAGAMETDEYLECLGAIARGEWGAYIETDETGRVLHVNFTQLRSDGKCHLIQGAEQTRGGIKVKFPSRIDALRLIGQGLGILGSNASEADLAAFIERFGSADKSSPDPSLTEEDG